MIPEKQKHFDSYKIRIYNRNKALHNCEKRWVRKGLEEELEDKS